MRYCKNCGNELAEDAKFCPKCGTAVATEPLGPSTPVAASACSASSGFKMAFWWERFLAWLVDVVLVGIIVSIVTFLTSLGGFPVTFTIVPGWPDWLPFFNFNLNGLVLFLYWMFLESVYGQSLGKMLMRIRVTRLDGSPVAVMHAALESVGKAFILPIDVLIGWLLYPKCRQRVFNYISQTIVLKVS